MSSETKSSSVAAKTGATGKPLFGMLGAIGFSHFLNDTIQSLMLAIYPLFKTGFGLSFGQIGLITLAFQFTASLLQPVVGFYTDRHPKPQSMAFGMACTLSGLVTLSIATSFPVVLVAAALIGLGSSIFHPESARVARMVSGGQYGLAQSIFQVGGNAGTAIGPLLAAYIVLPRGQGSVAWFSLAALLAMTLLWWVGGWAHGQLLSRRATGRAAAPHALLPRQKVVMAITVLGILVFSKYIYMASLTSYYTFYLMQTFGLGIQEAQVYLFLFLGAVAVGTVVGGPVGDRFGRKVVIWGSILGILPFTLALPYVNLFWTAILTVLIGLILASAFSAILVYAQELVPGRVGVISGLFFGFAFGMGGLGSALLGILADWKGISFVYHLCSFLPLLGILTILLPNVERHRAG